MTQQDIRHLQSILEREKQSIEELRKGTLYIVGTDGANIANDIIALHEKRAIDAAVKLADINLGLQPSS